MSTRWSCISPAISRPIIDAPWVVARFRQLCAERQYPAARRTARPPPMTMSPSSSPISSTSAPGISNRSTAPSRPCCILARAADVVLLTNLPHSAGDHRRENLAGHGLNFPVVTNSGPKGPAINDLAQPAPADPPSSSTTARPSSHRPSITRRTCISCISFTTSASPATSSRWTTSRCAPATGGKPSRTFWN